MRPRDVGQVDRGQVDVGDAGLEPGLDRPRQPADADEGGDERQSAAGDVPHGVQDGMSAAPVLPAGGRRSRRGLEVEVDVAVAHRRPTHRPERGEPHAHRPVVVECDRHPLGRLLLVVHRLAVAAQAHPVTREGRGVDLELVVVAEQVDGPGARCGGHPPSLRVRRPARQPPSVERRRRRKADPPPARPAWPRSQACASGCCAHHASSSSRAASGPIGPRSRRTARRCLYARPSTGPGGMPSTSPI